MINLSILRKTFTLQQDQSDCGVACLLSIIRYYGGANTPEKLRELSGTTITGTTLLGLYQCANKIGFNAEAFEADLNNIIALKKPCILHVLMVGNLQHYIVCYGYDSNLGVFIVGDPAKGITQLKETDLNEIWQSKTLLQLQINESFELKKDQNNIKWLWFRDLVKHDINILIIAMVLGIFATVLNLATAIFSQKLIDKILPSGNHEKLITSLILLFLILLIRVGISFIRQHFLLLQSRDFNNRIVGNFFKALIRLPKSFYDTRKTGDMITRMNDTSRIQKNIAFITGSVFIDIIILFTTSFFLVNYSLIIALVTFAFIPIIVLVILSYTKPIKNYQTAVMSASAMNESNYIDTINGIMVIKAHNQENLFSAKINTIYGNLQNQAFALGRLGNRFSITTDIIGVILSLVLITIASFMVLNKQLKIGEMMAIISLANTLIPAVARLSQINLQLQEAKVAFERMYDFTSIKPEFVETLLNETDILTFESLKVNNVSFRFAGRKPILNSISLSLNKGEIIALLGESGCGKSTFLQILQKFYNQENGIITLNGNNFENVSIPVWRNMIATVPQDIKIFSGTLLYNIILDDKIESIDDFHQFCVNYDFDKYFSELPQGYFTTVGEEGINLSGGQKQLVAIARALYKKPQILILDEVTSAMDSNTENFILQLLLNIKSEISVILVTHKPSTAKIANRVYLIENGVSKNLDTPKKMITGFDICVND